MRKRWVLAATQLALAAAAPTVAVAHHSTEVFYDRARTFEFIAVLQKFEMINPHVWFHFDETTAGGGVKSWRIEADHPSLIRRAMMDQFGGPIEFEAGKTYTVQIEPAWHNKPEGYLKRLVLPSGAVFTCC